MMTLETDRASWVWDSSCVVLLASWALVLLTRARSSVKPNWQHCFPFKGALRAASNSGYHHTGFAVLFNLNPSFAHPCCVTLGKFLHLCRGNGLDEFQIPTAGGCSMWWYHAFVWVSWVHLKTVRTRTIRSHNPSLGHSRESWEEEDLEFSLQLWNYLFS